MDLGIELWGSAADPNTEIIERFQPPRKTLKNIVAALWFDYLLNEISRTDFQVTTVKAEIINYFKKC